MPKRKTISMETVATPEILTEFFNDCGDDCAFANRFLGNSTIRSAFKQHLKDCGITEGITENTVEAGFFDWFSEYMENSEMKVIFYLE